MGFNLLKFYKKFGSGAGYIRLSYDFLKPYVRKYKEMCEAEGLQFFISDSMHKEKSCSGSCCGILDTNEHFDYARKQMTFLILLAKKKGFITLDMANEVASKTEMSWRKNTKVQDFMNLGSCASKRSRLREMNYDNYFERQWNGGFFERYFGGTIYRKGKDKKGNAIYYYNYKKANL